MIVAVLRDMEMFVTYKKVQSVNNLGNRELLRHEGDNRMQGRAHSSPRSGRLTNPPCRGTSLTISHR